MPDNTRDLVIALRAVVERLEKAVDAMEAELVVIRAERARDAERRGIMMWLGGAVIAAAGGTGAVVAKWLGWATVVAAK